MKMMVPGSARVLGIDDHYVKGDPELTRILKERLSKYLGKI
jgi:predicted protein tyrosine phosphatase